MTQKTDTATGQTLPEETAFATTSGLTWETSIDQRDPEIPQERRVTNLSSWHLETQYVTGLERESNAEQLTEVAITRSDPWVNTVRAEHYAGMQSELDAIRDKRRMANYDAVTDPVALFILRALVEADGLSIAELDELLANGRGWLRIIRLVQAGLVDLAGEYIEIAPAGRQAYAEVTSMLGSSS